MRRSINVTSPAAMLAPTRSCGQPLRKVDLHSRTGRLVRRGTIAAEAALVTMEYATTAAAMGTPCNGQANWPTVPPSSPWTRPAVCVAMTTRTAFVRKCSDRIRTCRQAARDAPGRCDERHGPRAQEQESAEVDDEGQRRRRLARRVGTPRQDCDQNGCEEQRGQLEDVDTSSHGVHKSKPGSAIRLFCEVVVYE